MAKGKGLMVRINSTARARIPSIVTSAVAIASLARLEHPGIVPVHDFGDLPDGRLLYAMQRVRGDRLDRWMASGRDLSERLGVFLRVCEAVAFAHARGVVHRDLKPENVRSQIVGIVIGSTVKRLLTGITIGFFATKVRSLALGTLFGLVVGAFFAYLILLMNPGHALNIMLLGSLVGVIVGYTARKHESALRS